VEGERGWALGTGARTPSPPTPTNPTGLEPGQPRPRRRVHHRRARRPGGGRQQQRGAGGHRERVAARSATPTHLDAMASSSSQAALAALATVRGLTAEGVAPLEAAAAGHHSWLAAAVAAARARFGLQGGSSVRWGLRVACGRVVGAGDGGRGGGRARANEMGRPAARARAGARQARGAPHLTRRTPPSDERRLARWRAGGREVWCRGRAGRERWAPRASLGAARLTRRERWRGRRTRVRGSGWRAGGSGARARDDRGARRQSGGQENGARQGGAQGRGQERAGGGRGRSTACRRARGRGAVAACSSSPSSRLLAAQEEIARRAQAGTRACTGRAARHAAARRGGRGRGGLGRRAGAAGRHAGAGQAGQESGESSGQAGGKGGGG